MKNTRMGEIIKFCEQFNISFKCFAFTGIAASLLKKGQTLHQGFGLPLKFKPNGNVTWIPEGSISEKELISTEVIFIDKISMVSKPTIEFIDEYLKSIKKMMNYLEVK